MTASPAGLLPAQEREAAERDSGELSMVHEVAASVFGERIMRGGPPAGCQLRKEGIACKRVRKSTGCGEGAGKGLLAGG